MTQCIRLIQDEIKRVDKEISQGKTYTHDGIHLKTYKKELSKLDNESERKRLISLLTEPYKRTIVANLGLVFDAVVNNKEDKFVLKDVEISKSTNKIKLIATNQNTNISHVLTLNTSTNLTEESHILPGGAALAHKVYRNHFSENNDVLHPEYRKAVKESVDTINSIVLGSKEYTGDENLIVPKTDNIIADYVHGDTDHMKRLLIYMHDLGGKKESEEHLNNLLDLIDHMHPRFFREMNLAIEEDSNTTAGYVDITNNNIRFSISTKIGPQSGAEVVAHELVHTMVAWALRVNTPQANRLKQQLQSLIKTAIKHTTYADFLGKPEDQATKKEIEYAKQLYKYIFNSEYVQDEFLAHALTNENVIKHFKTIKLRDFKNETLFDKIKNFFSVLMDIVLGNYNFKDKNNTVYTQVYELAFKLAELNTKTEAEIKSRLWFSNMYESVTNLDSVVAIKVQDAVRKHFPPEERPKGEKIKGSTLSSLILIAKYLFKGIYNPKYRNIVGKAFTDIGLKPNSEIREFIRDFLATDDVTFSVEQLGLLNNAIDLQRNSEIGAVRLTLKDKLKGELSLVEDEAVTVGLLDTNASFFLNEGKTVKDIQTYLTDEDLLDKEIENTVKKIKNTREQKNFNKWRVKQAKILGKYMATGETSLNMNFNPYAISIGIGLLSPTDINYNVNKELEQDIEKLATLYAIKYTRKDIKETLYELINNEPDFIESVLDVYEANKKTAKNEVFKNNKLHYVLGHSRQLTDSDIKVIYAPVNETTKAKMKAEGYTLIREIDNLQESLEDPVGIYITKADTRPERVTGALSYNNERSKGFTLKRYLTEVLGYEIIEANVIIENLKNQTNELNKKLLKSNNINIPYGSIAPLYDNRGNIIDYRILIDKEYKKVHLKSDLRVLEVLPRTVGSTSEKILRTEHERKVLEVLKEFNEKMIDKFGLDEDMREYALIGAKSSDPNLKAIYHSLPPLIREYADKQGHIAVPYDLVRVLFGYKHFKLVHMPILKLMPEKIKNVVSIIEEYWVDLIKIAKANILLKIPPVLITNIISNFFYEVMNGTSPVRVLELYVEHYRNAKNFLDTHKDYVQTMAKLRVAEHKAETKKDNNTVKEYERLKIKAGNLEKLLDANPVKELFDLGLLQSIVEDIELVELDYSNKITALTDRVKSKTPQLVQTGLNWLYLTKETAWYSVMEDVLQMSDLVARAVRNDIMKENEKKMIEGKIPIPHEIQDRMFIPVEQGKLTGERKKDFLKAAKIFRERELSYAFINYVKPNGKFEEWLNRIGLIMFTKYVKRIQRIVANLSAHRPMTGLLGLTVADRVFNAETIYDSSLFLKGELFPLYSPADNFERVVVPPLISLFW